MLRKIYLTLIAVAALALPASAQTVDEIIAKHVQARGGMDKLKAAKTMRLTARLTVGPGIEAPAIIEQKRPNSFRLELTVQGLTAIQAFDGKTGWMIMPFGGKKDPEPMGEDDLKQIAEQADFDGPLVDYKEKGSKVEMAGKEQVEGADAYKLKVTMKSGDVTYVYLDADAYLTIKEEGKRTVRGVERESQVSLGDYKEEGGLMLPHSMEIGAKGSPEKQKVVVEKVEINVPVDDSRFKMPEVKKPEAKPEEKKPPQ